MRGHNLQPMPGRILGPFWRAAGAAGACVCVAWILSGPAAAQVPPPAQTTQAAKPESSLFAESALRTSQTASAQAPTGLAAGDPGATPGANYGRPRPALRRPAPNPTQKPTGVGGKPALPALEPYPTSYEARRRARAARPGDPRLQTGRPPPGVAALPTPAAPRRRTAEPNPYAPLGVRLGGLVLRPYLDVDGGYDANPYRVNQPQRGSKFVHGEVGAQVQSDWSVHALRGQLRLGYYGLTDVANANRPEGRGALDGRIDITRDTQIDLGGAFSIDTLRPGSPEIRVGTTGPRSTNRPVTWSLGGYAGLTHRFNRLELSLRGTLERAETGDAYFADGSTQRLSLSDYTTVGLRPRIAYELTPGVKPFVEAIVDRRMRDSEYDLNGYRRDSTGLALRGGASVEVTRLVTAELAAGYAERRYADARLTPLRGPTVDAALIWTATPLTTVTLRGATTLNETTIPNASGAVSRRVTGEISHALLRNLTLSGSLGYQVTSYQGRNLATVSANDPTGLNERLLTATVRAEYSLTRTLVLRGSYQLQHLKSTVPGADYTANVMMLGLRLQR